MDSMDVYRSILRNDKIKKEFQEYVRIIVRTIADESYPYVYVLVFFVVLNFFLILAILILLLLRQ